MTNARAWLDSQTTAITSGEWVDPADEEIAALFAAGDSFRRAFWATSADADLRRVK